MWRISVLALTMIITLSAPAEACNPQPPRPPILEGHEYDDLAREYLTRDATTIAIARYVGRLDFLLETPAGSETDQPDYVFELYQGWKSALPARLVIPGYWVSCSLPLSPGRSYLLYLDEATPLFMLEADTLPTDLEVFGDLDWFYLPGGRLVLAELVEGVGQDGAGSEDGQ